MLYWKDYIANFLSSFFTKKEIHQDKVGVCQEDEQKTCCCKKPNEML